MRRLSSVRRNRPGLFVRRSFPSTTRADILSLLVGKDKNTFPILRKEAGLSDEEPEGIPFPGVSPALGGYGEV